jgi:hypothetical protein
MIMARHLTEADQLGWITNALPGFRRAIVAMHLSRCHNCRQEIEQLEAFMNPMEEIVQETNPTNELDLPPAHLDGLILHAARTAEHSSPRARPRRTLPGEIMLHRPAYALTAIVLFILAAWTLHQQWTADEPSAPQVAAVGTGDSIEAISPGQTWADPWTEEVEDRLAELEILLAMAEEDLYTPSTPDIIIEETDIDTEIQYLFQEIESEQTL